MAARRANLESFNVGDTFLTKYQIRGLIGRGGQATVYHSHDTYIDRDVAIKVMTDNFDAKREHSRRAQLEAQVLCKFHHPNIVHVYDAGATESGLIYIIMELLRGRTLRDVMRHLHKLTVYEALSLGAQIADGVEMAHQQHVIHRDLKPENIFVVDGNAVKVLDFGIAKFLTLTGITTQRDTLQGTMWYISPEHVQGFGVTPRSDIYALGSILYETISGTPPCLMGLQEITTQSVAYSQISRMPPQLDALMPNVPSHVGRLINRMLLKEPGKRHNSMAEVAELLRTACKRIKTEGGGSATELRELWHDESVKSEAELPSDLGVADTFKDPRSPNVMQPTVEVRQSVQGAAAEPGPAPVPSAAVPMESGIIIPTPPPIAHEPAAIESPVAATELPGGNPIGANAGPDDTAAPAADADLVQSKSTFSLRWRLVAIAVVIGTVVGIALEFTNSRSDGTSKSQTASAQPRVQIAVAAPVRPEPTQAIASPSALSPGIAPLASVPSATTASAAVQTAPQPVVSAVREPSPSAATTITKHANSGLNKESSASSSNTPRSKPAALSSDKGTSKKLPTSGLRPPYKSEDLE